MSIILQEIDKAKKSLPPLKINRNSSNVDKKPATPTSSSQSTPRDHQSKQNTDPASKTAASTRTDQSAARSTPTAAAAAAPVMSNESVSAAATSTKTPSNQKSSAAEAQSQPNQAQAQSQQKACKSTTLICRSFWSSKNKILLCISL